MYDVFYISLLEQNINKKGQVDENVKQINFDAGNNESKKYKIETI